VEMGFLGILCGGIDWLSYQMSRWVLRCFLVSSCNRLSRGCPICNQGPEDILHLLFQCPGARELWAVIGVLDIIDGAIPAHRAGSAVLEVLLRGKIVCYKVFIILDSMKLLLLHVGTYGGLDAVVLIMKQFHQCTTVRCQSFPHS
jgi:hypothetical protein